MKEDRPEQNLGHTDIYGKCREVFAKVRKNLEKRSQQSRVSEIYAWETIEKEGVSTVSAKSDS